MSRWGWKPERSQGVWRYGAAWIKPIVSASPWLTIILLVLMFRMIGDAMTSARGVLFDLPDAGISEGEMTELVALVMPMPHETLVFFDDARYMLSDGASISALREHLSDRVGKVEHKALLVLADRRVAGGELMKFAAIAKESGVTRVLFAEKKAERRE